MAEFTECSCVYGFHIFSNSPTVSPTALDIWKYDRGSMLYPHFIAQLLMSLSYVLMRLTRTLQLNHTIDKTADLLFFYISRKKNLLKPFVILNEFQMVSLVSIPLTEL